MLATIPLDSIALIFVSGETAARFKLFGVLKLVRLMRLNRIIRNLSVKKETKVVLKLAKLIFFLIMWVHCQSCLWFYLIRSDKIWMPPLDTIWGWQKQILFIQTTPYKYWLCTYTSLLFLTSNDLQPRGITQINFNLWGDFLGALMIANMFGELTILTADLNE